MGGHRSQEVVETHKASEGHLSVRGFVLGKLDLLAVSWAW